MSTLQTDPPSLNFNTPSEVESYYNFLYWVNSLNLISHTDPAGETHIRVHPFATIVSIDACGCVFPTCMVMLTKAPLKHLGSFPLENASKATICSSCPRGLQQPLDQSQ